MKLKEKTTEYELNTNLVPFFSGTYETQWRPTDIDDAGNELYLEYDGADLMHSIAGTYKDCTDDILTVINETIDFIDSIEFHETFYSPREYNFSTDSLNFKVTINNKKLMKKLDDLKNDDKFHKYLKDNFSSYDGFMSFTPNNYDDMKDNISNDGNDSDQAIGALITYLLSDIDVNYMDRETALYEIEYIAYEQWSCNGYNGLDYEVVAE